MTEDKNEPDIMDMNMDLLTKMFEQIKVTRDIKDEDGRKVGDEAKAEVEDEEKPSPEII